MTTVILVLLCLAIAGRELYLASDKRLPRALAELREVRAQLTDLGKRQEALRTEVAEVAQAGEAAGIPIPHPRPDEPPSDVLDRLDKLGSRVDRLEHELGRIGAHLSELDLDRDARHALARSLDAAEQVVGELQAEMLDRLDREEGVVAGLLLSEEGEAEALLTGAYERCAAEHGLRVRARDERSAQAAGGAYRGTAFQLSGRRGDTLSEELFGHVRGLRDPSDTSALAALLGELAHLRGGGMVRIGSFSAVRTPNALVCGLLPVDAPPTSEPWELAGLLHELPDHARADLSWLR